MTQQEIIQEMKSLRLVNADNLVHGTFYSDYDGIQRTGWHTQTTNGLQRDFYGKTLKSVEKELRSIAINK